MRCGQRLTHCLRLPQAHCLHMEKVCPQLILCKGGGISTPEVLTEQPQLAVVTVARAQRIVTQCQKLGKALHRWPEMIVMQRIGIHLSAAHRCR